jgi:triphosphoribosyl-dephospho-CoA synthase
MGGNTRQAAFFMLSRLMQTVEDTTALHRCGRAGLAQLQRDGRLLEAMLTEGFDPVPLLTKLNVEYRALNLTMGGVADLLGLALGCLSYEGYAVGDWLQPETGEREFGVACEESSLAIV